MCSFASNLIKEKEVKIKMMSKKGQAAMEFLMTYGWAILIAIIAIAALIAFGVLNPPLQKACGTDGILVQGVSCSTAIPSFTTKDVALTITNNLAEPLELSGITITPTAGGTSPTITDCDFPDLTGTNAIASGATVTMTSTTNCVGGNAGENFKGDLAFTYSTDGGTTTYPATSIKIAQKIAE